MKLRGVVEPDFLSSLPQPTVEKELERLANDANELAGRTDVDPAEAAHLRKIADDLFAAARTRSPRT